MSPTPGGDAQRLWQPEPWSILSNYDLWMSNYGTWIHRTRNFEHAVATIRSRCCELASPMVCLMPSGQTRSATHWS